MLVRKMERKVAVRCAFEWAFASRSLLQHFRLRTRALVTTLMLKIFCSINPSIGFQFLSLTIEIYYSINIIKNSTWEEPEHL